MICPSCKEPCTKLVKKYHRINTLTGKGESVEFEKSVCEDCASDLLEMAREKASAERKNSHVTH